MKVSVIIPTIRPSEPLLMFQLPSLAAQTMPKTEWELILIDDFPISREARIGEFADLNCCLLYTSDAADE